MIDHLGIASKWIGLAEGGKVGIASDIAKLIEEYVSKTHDYNRMNRAETDLVAKGLDKPWQADFGRSPNTPVVDETELEQLGNALQYYGVDPMKVLEMHQEFQPAGTQLHAGGGSTS